MLAPFQARGVSPFRCPKDMPNLKKCAYKKAAEPSNHTARKEGENNNEEEVPDAADMQQEKATRADPIGTGVGGGGSSLCAETPERRWCPSWLGR